MWYTMIMKNWRLENETKDKADYIILYYHICAGDIGRVGNVRIPLFSVKRYCQHLSGGRWKYQLSDQYGADVEPGDKGQLSEVTGYSGKRPGQIPGHEIFNAG